MRFLQTVFCLQQGHWGEGEGRGWAFGMRLKLPGSRALERHLSKFGSDRLNG